MALNIVLGTSSKYRRAVFDRTGLKYTVIAPDINEQAICAGFDDRSRADPELLTVAIAKAKADVLIPKVSEPSLLITCDQVVFYHGTIREKPIDEKECREFLASYSDDPACTCAAVVVTNTSTGRQVYGVDIARQYFSDPVPDNIVDQLITKGDIMWCCGGFLIDDPLIEPYLGRREGTEDSILGLPLTLVENLLRKATEE